ncbi:CDP-alcohol phosphatidyltransferase family protein [candidate division KSB1 bacterium]|nr:MAG: CDP-alcohol phosphatidyltransferase family protein [candidate division KSB1 bacterium]
MLGRHFHKNVQEIDVKLKIKFIPESIARLYLKSIELPVRFFTKLEIHPNFFTFLGLLLAIISAVCLCLGKFLLAGFLILIGGTFDVIDGKVARATGRGSKFGALFDSTLDRYSEVFLFFGLGFFFVRNGMYVSSLITFVALGGSMMVSYVRARSEGLGFQCKIGIMQRQERIVYLGFGSMFSGISFLKYFPIIAVIWLIAFFANLTSIQRIYFVWQQAKKGETP